MCRFFPFRARVDVTTFAARGGNVHANGIRPMMYLGGMTPDVRETRRARSLLKVEGTGWDCGAAVLFLASGHARWITGVILPVDAGTTATTTLDGSPYGRQ